MPPSFISGNLLTGSVLTVSSEDAAFPKDNLRDGDFANPLRFTSGTSSSVEIDFLSAKSFDRLFIGNHNFDPSVTLTVKAGGLSPPTTVIDTPSFKVESILSKFTEQSARFLRLEITDAQPGGGVTEIGELVAGLRVKFPRGIRFGSQIHIQQESIRKRTNRGKRYALELFRLPRRAYTFRFPQSERQAFLDWWEAVRGNLDPFVWIEDDDGDEALFVSLDADGFLPDELPDQALAPYLDYQVTLVGEGTGAAITV
ncbi:MAG: hypothetical protein V3R83_09895 [Gammaproteobacteria bacterium]